MSGTTEGRDAGEARRQHRTAWFVVLVIGAVVIVFVNRVGLGPWLVAGVLAVLMIIFGLSIRDTEVSSDSKGDSFYYLGLLFTFIALIAALVAFDSGSDATRTIGIILNFGIALVTTILGLAGRVWYAMSGDAPGDLEEAIRGDLEDAVSQMKASLDRARNQLDILVVNFEESRGAMAANVEAMAANVEAMAATAEINLSAADRAARTAETLDERTNRVAGAAESLGVAMNAFQDAVESGTSAARGVHESLNETAEQAASLGKELASAEAGFRAFKSVVAEAGKAAVPVARTIREASEGLASAASETASLRGAVSGLRRRAREVNSAVDRIGSDAVDAGGALAEARTQADRASRDIQGLTAQASSVNDEFASIRESAGKARSGIGEVVAGAGSLKEQLAAIDGRRLTNSVDSARDQSDQLGSAVSGLRDRSRDVSQLLTTAGQEAEKLTEETREARRTIRARRKATGLLRRVFGRRRNRGSDPDSR
jgi:chromosome segregation ATPase